MGDGVWLAPPLEPVAAAVPWLTGVVVTAVDGLTSDAVFAAPIAASLPVPTIADGTEDAVTPIFGVGRVGGSRELTSADAAETACAPCESLSCSEWL